MLLVNKIWSFFGACSCVLLSNSVTRRSLLGWLTGRKSIQIQELENLSAEYDGGLVFKFKLF